ncbi:MAG: phosphoribosylanthranilate isomerase [Candidatus Brocadiia bacterium]
MVKVKICGLTNVRDARYAVRRGADALGFNFVPSSSRFVEPSRAQAIICELPPLVSKVGIFVDEDPERMKEIAESCGLDYLQLHGRESPRVCNKLRDYNVIKALRIRDEDDVKKAELYRVSAYLLDAYVVGQEGGTGETFNWELARAAARGGYVILAGGLTPQNVRAAIEVARPYAVDVASGVEDESGEKSKELVEAFIRRAKSIDV